MTGILDDLGTWESPATWAVGDPVNADTWTERVYNPLSLLLRRPLTVATQSADTTVGTATSDNIFTFDTLVQDDDGMMIDDSASTFSEFYAQRDGLFAVYMSAPFVSNTAVNKSCKVAIWVNSSTTFAREGPVIHPTSGRYDWRAVNGNVSLTEGDYVQIKVDNQTSLRHYD